MRFGRRSQPLQHFVWPCYGLWKVEDGSGKFGIRGAECERIGAAAATNVEQSLSAVELHPLGHQACRTEGPEMLSRAELLSADSSSVNKALIEPLIGEYPFPT